MNTLRNVVTISMLVAALVVVVACVGGASEAEIDQACQNLTKIQPSENADETKTRLAKCKTDLSSEGVSTKTAQCRAKAANVDAFWNKCR